MENTQTKKKVYIVTIIILTVLSLWLAVLWINATRDERISNKNLDVIASTVHVAFPEGTYYFETLNTIGWFGSGGNTSGFFVIPPQYIEAFTEQLSNSEWVEYTDDMYDALADEYVIWKIMDYDEVPIDTFTHGYMIFLGYGENPSLERAVFYNSKGNDVFSTDEAMLFYNDITGRLYFFTHSSKQ